MDIHTEIMDHLLLRRTANKDVLAEMQSFQAILTHLDASNIHRVKQLVRVLFEAYKHRVETTDYPEEQFLCRLEEMARRRIEEPAITNDGAISQQVQALAVHVEKTARAVKGNDDV
jgi:hypothetical protein